MTLAEAKAQSGGVTREQARRLPGESMDEYRPWRDAYAAQRFRDPPTRTVYEPVEVIREVEVIKEVEVYRDRPETLEALEKAKADIDAARAPQEKRKFQTDFLEEERLDGEDLAATDRRLSEEYGILQVKRPLSATEEYRRRKLQDMLFEYRG